MPVRTQVLHCRQQGGVGGIAIRLLVYFLEQGQEAKTQSRELRGWGSGGADASTNGTKEHPATLPQPTRSQTQKKKSRAGRKVASPTPCGTSQPAFGDLPGAYRSQGRCQLPAMEGREEQASSAHPTIHGGIIIRNCMRPAPAGLARWHVRGLEASFDALDSL